MPANLGPASALALSPFSPTFLFFKVDLRVYYYLLTFTQPLLSRPHPSAWSSLAAKYQQGLAGQAPEAPEMAEQKRAAVNIHSWLGGQQGLEAGLRCMAPWSRGGHGSSSQAQSIPECLRPTILGHSLWGLSPESLLPPLLLDWTWFPSHTLEWATVQEAYGGPL